MRLHIYLLVGLLVWVPIAPGARAAGPTIEELEAQLAKRKAVKKASPVVSPAATPRLTTKPGASGAPATIPIPAPASTGYARGDVAALMIDIPVGTFRMGDSVGFGSSDEKPVHLVSVRSFRLSKFEVTVGQWAEFRADTANVAEGCGTDPREAVRCVGWGDALSYIEWLNRGTAGGFRLPSEAEWEYAARAGSSASFPWGNEYTTSNANGAGVDPVDRWDKTAPVGQFPANRFGLYDIIGNVWEWTQDCWNGSYTGAPAGGQAWVTGSCINRVLRGGSWSDQPNDMRLSKRIRQKTTFRDINMGFRVAQDVSGGYAAQPTSSSATGLAMLSGPSAEEYYPAAARAARQEGRPLIKVCVSVQGGPTSVEVAESSGFPELDQAGLRLALASRYRPASEAGRPVASCASLPVRFSLQGG